jgi:AcrR family transcriptional regulator
VTLTREHIIETAYATLRDRGLAGLSMRRLAQDLEVQPGALYYHVPSKQEMLAAVAERILADTTAAISGSDPVRAAADLRGALLRVRDSAEVISFAHAFRPGALSPLRGLEQLFAGQFTPQQARWAAQTLMHYVLGFVAEEQNRAELVRAGIVGGDPDPAESSEAFSFGVSAILRGIESMRSLSRSAN